MKTIKSYTSLEQSKRLAKILPIESADMWYHGHNGPMTSDMRFDNEPAAYHSLRPNWDMSCWSLAALLELMPKLHKLQHSEEGYYCSLANYKCVTESYNNPIDACYEMILNLHELKML